jgi:uncharacterized protein YpmB
MRKKVRTKLILTAVILLAISIAALYIHNKHGQPVNEEAIKKNVDSTANSKLDDLNELFKQEQDSLH